jgi:hypothetical protein
MGFAHLTAPVHALQSRIHLGWTPPIQHPERRVKTFWFRNAPFTWN